MVFSYFVKFTEKELANDKIILTKMGSGHDQIKTNLMEQMENNTTPSVP